MTFADYIAACFLPLAILSGLVLAIVRDRALFQYVATAALAIGVIYFFGLLFMAQRSIVAIVEIYVIAGALGLATLGFGYNRWGRHKPGNPPRDLKEKLCACLVVFLGATLVWISATTLVPDFAQPRLVLEGRADNLRLARRRNIDYLVDIAGRTVKATTPVYERLKLKPYVRAEVGRGSNYIYKIEYLAN
jgi:hypothetical protein